ncbi:Transport-associated (modular protein) [Paraburkholderia ribeironis]|uniref:Transport-associated (Modular protein) n=1 Tax=Paraburkholderia ribeironis TaxID=1247936 RepID=A0A1N7SIR2_9BURK|nr:Transport-associated (modular protein) [Paraburkholderia ribeironis]
MINGRDRRGVRNSGLAMRAMPDWARSVPSAQVLGRCACRNRRQVRAHLLVFSDQRLLCGEPVVSTRSAKPKPAGSGAKARPPTDADTDATRLSDAQIAVEATRRLAWDAAVPEHTVTVKVSRGRITLEGVVEREQQRAAALEDVGRLFGVRGVVDHIVVKAK